MTKETRVYVWEAEGAGHLLIKGHGHVEVFYTIRKEQKTIVHLGIGAAPGNGDVTGTIRRHDGSLIALSTGFPAKAVLTDKTGVKWAIFLESDGTFTATAFV